MEGALAAKSKYFSLFHAVLAPLTIHEGRSSALSSFLHILSSNCLRIDQRNKVGVDHRSSNVPVSQIQ